MSVGDDRAIGINPAKRNVLRLEYKRISVKNPRCDKIFHDLLLGVQSHLFPCQLVDVELMGAASESKPRMLQ